MRIVKSSQSSFGQVDIAKIEFNARSRDDIAAVLKGLQFLYVNADVREKVFALRSRRRHRHRHRRPCASAARSSRP